eukprot:1222966-Pyramimonas_sp.AAC.1
MRTTTPHYVASRPSSRMAKHGRALAEEHVELALRRRRRPGHDEVDVPRARHSGDALDVLGAHARGEL